MLHPITLVSGQQLLQCNSVRTWEGMRGATRVRGGMAPAWTACAALTMAEPCAWRKTSRRSTTGTAPDSIAAARNEPAPTGGSWSASPAAPQRTHQLSQCCLDHSFAHLNASTSMEACKLRRTNISHARRPWDFLLILQPMQSGKCCMMFPAYETPH